MLGPLVRPADQPGNSLGFFSGYQKKMCWLVGCFWYNAALPDRTALRRVLASKPVDQQSIEYVRVNMDLGAPTVLHSSVVRFAKTPQNTASRMPLRGLWLLQMCIQRSPFTGATATNSCWT